MSKMLKKLENLKKSQKSLDFNKKKIKKKRNLAKKINK